MFTRLYIFEQKLNNMEYVNTNTVFLILIFGAIISCSGRVGSGWVRS